MQVRTRSPRSLFTGLVFLALAVAAPAHAALEPLTLDEAVELMESLGGLDEFPNANSIVAFDRTYVEFDRTGAYQQYGHTFVKILTDEGRDDNGSASFTFNRRYATVEVVMARVIKADGTEIVVGDDLITEGTPPQVAAMNIFESDFREKTVVFPGLEVGDCVEYLVRQDYEPLIKNGFNGIYFLQYVEPILEAAVTIVGPSELPLRYIVKDGEAEFSESTDSDRTTYTWTVNSPEVIERELGMVPPRQLSTRLIVSTIQTWPELSRYVWEMFDEKCVADEAIRDLVAELTDGLDTEEEKITAIYHWILENVRYLGIAMDRGAFLEPHYASYTFEKEYGICRDKATLMVAMLKEIGVPAWIVACNPSHRMDTEIPTIYFEHGIVAIKDENGDYFYMDPTLEGSRDLFPAYLGDRHVLVATEDGEDLVPVPHVPASANQGRIADSSVLSENGDIDGNVTITGVGFYEYLLRIINKNAGAEQLRMRAEQMVQSVYPGAELTDFSVTDPDDLGEPTTITLTYHIDAYSLDADPYVLFRVPGASGAFEVLSDFLFGQMVGLPERKYPVAIGVTLGVEETAEVVLPAGYTVENLPDSVGFQEGIISLSMGYEYIPDGSGDGGTIRYERTFGIEGFQIDPPDYLSLKEAVRLASRSKMGEVILKREEG